jgi:hypothetical protein
MLVCLPEGRKGSRERLALARRRSTAAVHRMRGTWSRSSPRRADHAPALLSLGLGHVERHAAHLTPWIHRALGRHGHRHQYQRRRPFKAWYPLGSGSGSG